MLKNLQHQSDWPELIQTGIQVEPENSATNNQSR